jgi:gliding motility-associated-like protein
VNELSWTISNGVCGTSNDTVALIGADIPLVDAGQDTTIFEDNGYQLSVSTDIPVVDYRWDPVFSLDNATIQRPFAHPSESTTYTVKVTTSVGCEAVDDVTLTVIKDLVIPTAFTPNGDRANDTWEIKNLDQYESHSVVVYDGYGSEVLRTTTYENWNGKYKGNMLPVGSYVYVIELKLGSNNTYKSGAISILR